MNQSQKITPFLWFDNNAEEAANFYTALFANAQTGGTSHYDNAGEEVSGKPAGSVMTVEFEVAGHKLIALNGGPQFKFNPAISFYLTCETEAEIERLWAGLSQGGSALMPLDKYAWSEKYGWVADRYGINWQLTLGNVAEMGQAIVPCLMFVGAQHGRAAEAIDLYTEIFDHSEIDLIARYEAGEGDTEGAIKHAQFRLNGQKLIAMDSGLEHQFSFNEAISLQISCETQEEIDHFWAKLTADGGEEGRCGWLKDKFGVSWQVVPTALAELLGRADAAQSERVTQAFLQMNKFDIEALERAYAGAIA